MNILEIKQGQIYKNYKELCEHLGEQPKTGKSKQLQLKDWERYFTYHKNGNKFVIDEVFSQAKEKIDGRKNNKGGNNNVYAEELDRIVLSCIGDGDWTLNEIFTNCIPILTNKYQDFLKCGYELYAKNNDILVGLVMVYSQKLRGILERAITSSLERLKKQGKIEYEKGIIANIIVDKIMLNKEQEKELKNAEQLAYDEMGITHFQRINREINKQFKKCVCSKMSFDIIGYWNVYQVEQLTDEKPMQDNDIEKFCEKLLIQLHKAVINKKIDDKKVYRTDNHIEIIKLLDNRFINNPKDDLTNFAFACYESRKLIAELEKSESTIEEESNIIITDYYQQDIEDGIPF